MKHNRRHLSEELAAFLSRERAQTMPECAIALSADCTANANKGVVRLFI